MLPKSFTDTYYIALIYSKWAQRYPVHYIAVPMLLPIGTFISLAFNVPQASRIFAVSGPIVFAISLTSILYIGQWVGSDKMVNRWSLFASMPVSPLAYGMGIALSAAANAVISTSVILSLSVALFGLQPSWSWILLVPTYLLSFASGSCVGFLIANSSKDPRVITSTAQVVAFGFALFAPVFYPIEVIPLSLRWISLLIPTTFASILVRDSLLGDLGSFALYLTPFVVMTIVLLSMVVHTVKWRTK